mgnify:CR=1 FL=1
MDSETRLKQLGQAWFALNCRGWGCPGCESRLQCFKILAEMADLRRKQRENDVHIHSTR